jgi:hypothetical protein
MEGEPEDPKLARIFDALRGPPDEAADARLDAAWPDLVKKARTSVEQREAASRPRRWASWGALAVAASVLVVFGVARLLPRDEETKGGHIIDVPKGLERPDLTRPSVLEECWKTVGFRPDQRATSTSLADRARERIEALPSGSKADVAAIESDLRGAIGALLDAEQRRRFEEFCAERPR